MSLMNGLSAAGSGLASYSANYGAEQQKADAAAQLQQSGGVIAGGLQAQRAALEAEQARQADAMLAARESAGRQETARLQNEADTPEIKLFRALGVLPQRGNQASSTSSAASNGSSTATSSSGTAAVSSPPSGASTTAIDNPIVAKALGLPAPGSDDAIRRAIAAGVSSDPVFKDRSASDQAAEIKKRLASASASLSSDALDTIADRTIAGDTSALTGLGYGEGGAANRAAAQERITEKLKAKGMGGADLAAAIASFGGEKAGARTAGTREANVGMAVTEAQLFMPLALQASKAVPRTDFPTLNSIMLAAEKGMGGESVVRLAVATNSLVNAYARAITPSGIPTEGNQARARELLDKAWADGQYAAAIDQLGKEMAAAKASPVQQQAEQSARISGRQPLAPAGQTTPGSPQAAPTTEVTKPTPPAPVDPAAREVGKTYPLPNGKMGIWRGNGWELAQ